jgi:hypothetical protein
MDTSTLLIYNDKKKARQMKTKKPKQFKTLSTSKHYKAAMIVVIVASFSVMGFFLIRQASASTCTATVLRQGNSSNCVRLAKILLNEQFGPDIAVNRSFNAATTRLTQTAQRTYGLVADGVIGPQTWMAICTIRTASISSTATDARNRAGCSQVSVAPQGLVYPVRTTKRVLAAERPQWCSWRLYNCHHSYNAVDIFAPTDTIVQAARAGTVKQVRNDNRSAVGSRVVVHGDDGLLYYYAHMKFDSIPVRVGQRVSAGSMLGRIGDNADSQGEQRHLHFDVLPNAANYTDRPNCSNSACSRYPFIDAQSAVQYSYNVLPW